VIRIDGVAAGQYTLSETQAPDGLAIAPPQAVTVKRGKRTRATLRSERVEDEPSAAGAGAIVPVGGAEPAATPTEEPAATETAVPTAAPAETAPSDAAPPSEEPTEEPAIVSIGGDESTDATAEDTTGTAPPNEEPGGTAATGHVRVTAYACPDVTDPVAFAFFALDDTVDASACTAAAVTFTIVDADGNAVPATDGTELDLPVGSYTAVDDASGASVGFELTADGVWIVVSLPAGGEAGTEEATGDTSGEVVSSPDTESAATPESGGEPSGGEEPATNPAASGRLAYALKLGGHWDVYVYDFATADSTQLTAKPDSDEWAPAWSHDGSRLAYLSDATDGSNQVWLMDPDGGNQSQVTDWHGDGQITAVAWMVDDQTFVVTVTGDDGSRLMTAPLDGGELTEFVPAPAADAAVATDGRIAYVTEANGDLDVVLAAPDGSVLAPLAETSGNEDAPSFSPDGTLVAYQVGPKGSRHVAVVSADGGTPTPIAGSGGDDSDPVWSPDETALAYVADGGGQQTVRIEPVGGGTATQLDLPPHDGVWYLAWTF
jgi:hypothetical protein